jgi:hypothetical protein
MVDFDTASARVPVSFLRYILTFFGWRARWCRCTIATNLAERRTTWGECIDFLFWKSLTRSRRPVTAFCTDVSTRGIVSQSWQPWLVAGQRRATRLQ